MDRGKKVVESQKLTGIPKLIAHSISLKKSFESNHARDVSKSGFTFDVKVYKASGCATCSKREACTKSKEGNRTITVNNQLDIYKKIARTNLESPTGVELRKQRSVEIESCFGDIKHNMGFRRFHLRGIQKVKTEITIVSMAHNCQKYLPLLHSTNVLKTFKLMGTFVMSLHMIRTE